MFGTGYGGLGGFGTAGGFGGLGGGGVFALGNAIGHLFNGRYYLMRYLFQGYGVPSIPTVASSDAVIGEVTVGSQSMLVLFDNRVFCDYQWQMLY
jgi:hypothetical protein